MPRASGWTRTVPGRVGRVPFSLSMSDWFTSSPTALLSVVLSTLGVYVVLIALIRLVGLRSFSKMSSFDFAMTVATGSVLASTILSPSPPLAQAAVALASLFGVQFTIAWLRKRTSWATRVVDNEPLVLMVGAEIFHDNLRRARVTENDLWAKLREANVLRPEEVRAVVLETTGDISVLHGEPDGATLHPDLLRGVRDTGRVMTDA